MTRVTRRKGMILLQTLVMSVILSMIAVMVMQWVLGRYMTATRTYRSSASKVRSQGYSSNLFSMWSMMSYPSFGLIPTSGSTCMDGFSLIYSRGALSPTNGMFIKIDADQDSPDPSCP